MMSNQFQTFGLLPGADWKQLVRLSRGAGWALDVLLGRLLLGIVIGGGLMCLAAWSGPQEQQTQRRFDIEAAGFKTALQEQLVQSRRKVADANSPRHQENLLQWLDGLSNPPLRVRLYEENRGFPQQLLFDSLPNAAPPSGPVWMHGITQHMDVAGRHLTAVFSPLPVLQAETRNSFAEAALLLMVMGLALLFPFVLPQLTVNIANFLVPAHHHAGSAP